MRRKRRARPPDYEICSIPSDESLPPGDLQPCRHMDETERENLLIETAARILRECDAAAFRPAPEKSPEIMS